MFDVAKIREDFPILRRKVNGHPLVYLDNAATSQKPRQVIESLVDYYENHNANVHRGIHVLSEEATAMSEGARKKIAEFIGASSEKEVIFVRNASEAINLVMYSWGEKNISKGDAVVVGYQEHHSNLVTWQMLCKKKGAELRVINVDEQGRLVMRGEERHQVEGVVVGSLEVLLDEKVKMLALTQVSNVLGTVNDLERVYEMKKKLVGSALFLVDASQAVPYMPVEVKKLKCDFMVFSGHKMLGPTGIGVLWGKQEVLEEMDPFMYGGDMISEVKWGESKWNELPWKFEAGTPHIEGMIGLGAAVDYLSSLGMENVWQHERKLIEYALEKGGELEKKGWITIYGSRMTSHGASQVDRGGVFTFNVTGVHAHDSAQILDSFGIAVRSGQHCGAPITERLGVMATTRASFYIYTTKEEIDFMFEKIEEIRKVFRM